MKTHDSAGENIREDIPLKGEKKSPYYEEFLSGSKFVNFAFGILTIIITIALLLQIYYGDYQIVPHGSSATDAVECSKIGTTILKKGGNAMDASIASAFCITVYTPHLTSLESDGVLMIYNHRLRLNPKVIDFNHVNSTVLPRLVLGLAYFHKNYGSLPWKDLVEPSITKARDGILVNKNLVQAIQFTKSEHILGRLEAGQILKFERLAETLQRIADIPESDMEKYLTETSKPVETEAFKFDFQDYKIFVPNVPSIGPLLAFVLQQIERKNLKDINNPDNYYQIAKITDIVYKDLQVIKYNEGTTSNIATVDLHDNYVSLVMGMHSLFGDGEISAGGYIENTQSPSNSRFPIIAINKYAICGKRFIFGANNLALASQIISQLILGNKNVTDAIEAPRFHLTGFGQVGIEDLHIPFFSPKMLQLLSKIDNPQLVRLAEPYDSVNIVEKNKDDLSSHSDSRGGGIASRF